MSTCCRSGADPRPCCAGQDHLGSCDTSCEALCCVSESVEDAYRWIIREDDERHHADNACAECVPDGPILIEGFRCIPHQARAYLGFGSFTNLSSKKAREEGIPGGLLDQARRDGLM